MATSKKRNKYSIAISLVFLLVFGAVQAYAITSGQRLWVKQYNPNTYDLPVGMAIDKNNNVYVIGFSAKNAEDAGDGSEFEACDYVVVKYDSKGNRKWVRSYNGPSNGDDFPAAIGIDSNNNVYITGYSWNGSVNQNDIVTIKYDTNGNRKWLRRYESIDHEDDYASSLIIDSANNIYVAGQNSNTGYNNYSNPLLIKYDSSGNRKWVRKYENSAITFYDSGRLGVDFANNIYITGSSFMYNKKNFDYQIIKYDSSGNRKWVRRYDGGGNDYIRAVAVAKNGDIYVGGRSAGNSTSDDFATIKYDPSGNRKWVRRYNGPEDENGPVYHSDDFVNDLAIDKNSNLYVTGESAQTYATIKYDASGNRKWVRRYGIRADYPNYGNNIAVNSNGNIFVISSFYSSNSLWDFATIKYDSSGNRKWVKKYNGSSSENDEAAAIAIDANNNIYVTGYSWSSSTKNDFLTIKYAP